MRRPTTSNSWRSSPDRSKIPSRNTIITENASSNAKCPSDRFTCALQNSELRALPAVVASAYASRQSSHITGSLGKPFAHKNEPAEDNRSTRVSFPPPPSLHTSAGKRTSTHMQPERKLPRNLSYRSYSSRRPLLNWLLSALPSATSGMLWVRHAL